MMVHGMSLTNGYKQEGLNQMKKPKKDPKQHEEEYIQFLEKQIVWKKANATKEEVDALKFKLSKARLRLKLM